MRDANAFLDVSLMFFLRNNEVSKSPLAVLVLVGSKFTRLEFSFFISVGVLTFLVRCVSVKQWWIRGKFGDSPQEMACVIGSSASVHLAN